MEQALEELSKEFGLTLREGQRDVLQFLWEKQDDCLGKVILKIN